MAKKVITLLKRDFWFQLFSIIAVGLIVVSFFIPPTGVIDSSVFAGVGEIFAFAALYEVHRAIDKGVDASVTHNNTTITIDGKEEQLTNLLP